MSPTPHESSGNQRPGTESGSRQREGAIKILLVEHSPVQQRILTQILARAGAEVAVECDGQAAMRRLTSSPSSYSFFDLIVTALRTPVLDGIELTMKLRESGFTTPIVMCTFITDRVIHEFALFAGCSSVVPKSKALQILTHEIQYVLSGCLSD